MLETSAFQRGNSTLINSFGKTKFSSLFQRRSNTVTLKSRNICQCAKEFSSLYLSPLSKLSSSTKMIFSKSLRQEWSAWNFRNLDPLAAFIPPGCQAMLEESCVHSPAPTPPTKKKRLRRRPFLPRLYLSLLDESEMGDNLGFFSATWRRRRTFYSKMTGIIRQPTFLRSVK